MIHRFFFVFVCALSLSLLVNCAGSGWSGSDAMQYNRMITRRTEYYVQGPQQAAPPDGRFDEGTRIRIIAPDGSYVKVQSASGTTAYVESSAIGELPPQ
jgi:hypothetical protein